VGLKLAFKAFFKCLRTSPEAEKIALILESDPTKQLEAPKPKSSSSGQLLAAFQKEGRFIDFLQEDLSGFGDAQVGSVSRSVQEGCRKVLQQYLTLEPVLPDKEGETVTVEEGFDPHRIALVGKVEGDPPFKGQLRHHGWILATDQLPELGSAQVLLPAEVEL
jgi:Domain of unknown function (DUF2760)